MSKYDFFKDKGRKLNIKIREIETMFIFIT
jgi:hypothetical protein